jgi:hypothetical protein
MADFKPPVEADCPRRPLVGSGVNPHTAQASDGSRRLFWRIPMRTLVSFALVWLTALVVPAAAAAAAEDFGFPGFAVREVAVNDTTIHVRHGGSGPAVVLLHGYGETGDMWVPLARVTTR